MTPVFLHDLASAVINLFKAPLGLKKEHKRFIFTQCVNKLEKQEKKLS
jgi:hypothetical protein